MSNYTIKPYKKGYEIDQEQINRIVAEKWLYPTVRSVDQLREEYSKEDFDPETQFYCFDDHGNMVGYLNSQILDKEDGILKANVCGNLTN